MDQYTQEMFQETQEVLEVQEIYLGIQEMCAGKGWSFLKFQEIWICETAI